MTEAEWIACNEPAQMYELLGVKVTERKRRLCECGLAQSTWIDRRCLPAIRSIEGFADGHMDASQLADHIRTLRSVRSRVPRQCEEESAISLLLAAATGCSLSFSYMTFGPDTKARQLAVIRDILGNPFCPITLDSEWLTLTVLRLANHIYDNRDFSTMPILADALQDAGCDNEDILNHCRQPGEHVRGCWVVDLVLGKS